VHFHSRLRRIHLTDNNLSQIKIKSLFAIAILALALLFIPLARIFSLHSFFFDLGIFENYFFRIGTFNEWQLAFFGHSHWIANAYGKLYVLLPLSVAPYFLVGTQSILLVLPVIFFYRRFGLFMAYIYILFYPLWVNIHFDFHFDHLAIPLLMGFYLNLLDRRISWAILFATALIFVKETFALQAAACGILMLCTVFRGDLIWAKPLDQMDRRWLAIGGIWLIGLGLGCFYFMLIYLLPYYAPEEWQGPLAGDAFSWLGQGLGDILLTVVTEPHAILGEIITNPGKLFYLFVVFGLLGFIPLLKPAIIIPAIPMLAIAMLSHLPNYYDHNTHYTAGLIIPVLFAFACGLPKAEQLSEKLFIKIDSKLQFLNAAFLLGDCDKRKRLFYVLLLGWVLVGHIMLSPSPISRLFWSNKVWSHNWTAYIPTNRDKMIKVAIEKYVPTDSNVSVTTQNSLNYSHLAHRKVYLPFPLGIAEPQKIMDWSNRTWSGFWEFVRTGVRPQTFVNEKYADYVVLDLKRPLFLGDQGCGWIYGECRNKNMEEQFYIWVAHIQQTYILVFDLDGFMIFRRFSAW